MSNCIFFFFYRKKTHRNKVLSDCIFEVYVNLDIGKFLEFHKSISIILFLVFLNYLLFLECRKTLK